MEIEVNIKGGQILKDSGSKFVFVLLLVMASNLLNSCAEKEKKDRAHPASFVSETFAIDNGMPMREVQKQEFYFKKCELESRRPFQSRIEFSCNDN